jgi:hypothetical protein
MLGSRLRRGRKMNKDKKRHYIEKISSTLQNFGVGYLNRFLCPLCLNLIDISDLDDITIAHIIPAAANGKISTWTCRKCNSSIGSDVDKWFGQYINTLVNKNNLFHGIKLFTVNDIPIQGSIKYINNSISLIIDSKRNPRNILEILKNQEQTESRKNISFTVPLLRNFDLINIGFINAAYLYGFSIFGYSWVMQDHFDSIREAINKRDLSLTNNVFISNITGDTDIREHYFGIATINSVFVPYIKIMTKLIFFAPYYFQNALTPLQSKAEEYTLDVKRLSTLPIQTYTDPFIMSVGYKVILYPNKGKNKLPLSFVMLIKEHDFSISLLRNRIDAPIKTELLKTKDDITKFSVEL